MVIRAVFGFLKKMNHNEKDLLKKYDDEYRDKMIKQKEEYIEFKKNEGDSDLFFNEKDNRTKNRDNDD